MQRDLISYQRTICRIESIVYFDTAAAVHHLKSEKVHCEQRDYVPQNAHARPPARTACSWLQLVAAVAALASLPLLFALRADSILGAGTVMVVGGGTQWLLCHE
jgi:hypothetical protein